MVDDARKQLQERSARVGAKALARFHEGRHDLQSKALEETVTILKREERLTRFSKRDEGAQIVAANQPQDCKGARPHHAAGVARSRRRTDRIRMPLAVVRCR